MKFDIGFAKKIVELKTMDFKTLGDEVVATLRANVASLLSGSAEDVERYIIRIGGDIMLAAEAGREDLVANLADQALMVAELQRVRAVELGIKTLKEVVAVVGQFALAAVKIILA